MAKGKKITRKWVFEWHINGKGILGVNLETQKNSHLRGLIKTEKKAKDTKPKICIKVWELEKSKIHINF